MKTLFLSLVALTFTVSALTATACDGIGKEKQTSEHQEQHDKS